MSIGYNLPRMGHRVKAYSVADCGGSVCLLAAPWVRLSVKAGNG